jgi:chemotaxis signal transduction protein
LPAEISAIRKFAAGGEVFALPAATVTKSFAKPRAIIPIPLAPAFLKGIITVADEVIPVIDLAARMNLPPQGQAEWLLLLNLAGEHFAFLVESDLGVFTEKDFRLRSLPPLAKSSFLTDLVVHHQQIIPLVNPRALIAAAVEQVAAEAPTDRGRPESEFGRQFDHEKVTVMEFMLLGARHALPKNEVLDILPLAPFRRLPPRQSLVIGIIEYQGEILPVLDLALIFGRRSRITSAWRMILLHNGDFRAFIVSEATFPERELDRDSQKKIPLSLPHRLVYGCYPDGNIVRLIFNVRVMAGNFTMVIGKEFFSSLAPEAAAAPAEIGPLPPPAEELQGLEAETPRGEGPLLSEPARDSAESAENGSPPAEQTGYPQDSGPSAPAVIEDHWRNEAEFRPGHSAQPAPPEALIILEQPMALPAPATTVAQGGNSDFSARSGGETLPAPEPGNRATSEAALSRCLSEKLDQLAAAQPVPRKIEGGALPQETGAGEDPNPGGPEQVVLLNICPAQTRPAGRSPAAGPETATAEEPLSSTRQEDEAQTLITAANERAHMRETLARQKQKEELRRAEELPSGVVGETEIRGAASIFRHQREEQPRFAAETLAGVEEIARSVSGQWRRISAKERSRILDEFRGSKKKASKDHRRLLVLLALLFLLLIDVIIFFALPAQQPRQPAGATDSSQKLAPAGEPAPGPPAGPPARKPPARAPDQPRATQAVKGAQPVHTIIVPDHIPLATRLYTVQKGDTLWHISKRFTGDPHNYPFVAEDNAIGNPDLIFPDQHIRLQRKNREEERSTGPRSGL